MAVFTDLLEHGPELDDATVDHLQMLLAEWQILADLSFADLLLFVRRPLASGAYEYLCVAQMRPYTAQTIYLDDQVGIAYPAVERPMVGRAFAEGRVIRDSDPDWSTGVPVREEAIPVRFRDEVVAVISRESNVATARSPSQLELTYLSSAGQLAQMLADGTFPYSTGDRPDETELSPRVGDGIMRADASMVVTYASPNAISAYRRLGHIDSVAGASVKDFDPEAEDVVLAYEDGIPVLSEMEGEGAIVLRRVLPLINADSATGLRHVSGALLLVREVTELRSHQRALRVKDATIREIHHRVKNNLQTVASLLRLQVRRLTSDEAREALQESVRRISSIALVHETLSHESGQRVAFEQVANKIVDMLADGLVNPEIPVSFTITGSPGELPAEVATPLALVLTELLQNSVEHAFPEHGGEVAVRFERAASTLRVVVADDGVGLPEGRSLDALANLGLQIARTLVSSELGGTFDAVPTERGTTIELVIPLP